MSAFNDTSDDTRGGIGALMWTLAALMGAFAMLAALCGCRSFYENAGVHVRTGSLTAPVEVSEPTSSVNVRALYAMDGIDMYAAKNCKVKMEYQNAYTNSYLGVVETKGVQKSKVEIEPTEEFKETSTGTGGAER